MFSLGRVGWTAPHCSRAYAIALHPTRTIPGPRVFGDKKSFQYNWYTRIIKASTNEPLIFLSRDAFTAERLKKLRSDLQSAVAKVKAPTDAEPLPPPTLTVINGGIFGVALRNYPGMNLDEVQRMIEGTTGGYAVLSLPALHPPYLSAVLRALERSVPKRPEKTPEEIAKEEEAKNADPATPGRRAKRIKREPVPDLRVLGALVEGRVLLAHSMADVGKLPTLHTLRSQIVGLLSAPSTQLAGVLSQASGGMLARTLEGFKKGLEEEQNSTPPPS